MSSEVNRKSADSQIKYIFELLQSGEKKIRFNGNKDVVLVLGNTGAGKTSFTHFIAGDNGDLFSVEVTEGSGDFIIIDKDNKISNNSTIISQTLYPELLVDPKSNVAFYDCPGFSDTRSPIHDISGTFFVKKVIDSCENIKLILVVNYASVRKGVDRLDFLLLLKHVSNIIKNVDKFKDSIALIVSKVDNKYSKRNGSFTLIPDEKIIESIAEFLKRAKQDMQALSETSDSLSFYDKGLKLIDIFMEKDENTYRKIGLFRRPDEPGPLSKIALLQSGKKYLENIIHESTKFTTRDKNDFGYSISAESKNYVYDLGKEINSNIESEITSVGKNIENHFSRQESLSTKIYDLLKTFKLASNLFSKYELKMNKYPSKLAQDIITDIKELKLEISNENITNFLNFDEYIEFLDIVSNQTIEEPLRWVQGLKTTTRYLNDGQKWYNFLINLHNWFSRYEFQKNNINYQIDVTNYEKVNFKPLIDMLKKELPEENVERVFNEVRDIQVDHNKIKSLKRVVDFDFNHELESVCESFNKLLIRGRYVKLSDISRKHCRARLKFVEIFATQKVFIDVDLNKVGQKLHLSVIAPVWDIIGTKSIQLDGEPGYDRGKASNGYWEGEEGMNGQPGLPGGAAGNFFGIAGYVVGGNLYISANGGKGGRGEDGGDGADGRKGESVPPSSSSVTTTVFDQWGPEQTWNSQGFHWILRHKDNWAIVGWYYYKAYGKPASIGANGGDGGVGGKGGYAGNVLLLDYSNSIKISTSTRNGSDGDAGLGGNGGLSADNGYNRYVDCRTDRYILVATTYCNNVKQEYNGRSSSGYDGKDAANRIGIISPESQTKFIDPPITIKGFQDFAHLSPNLSLGEPYITEFYNIIYNNGNMNHQRVNRTRREMPVDSNSYSHPPVASAASTTQRSSLLNFLRDTFFYGVAFWKCIKPIITFNKYSSDLNESKSFEDEENRLLDDFPSFDLFKLDENCEITHKNEFVNLKKLIWDEVNTDYLITDNRLENDIYTYADNIFSNSHSNLLLWDLLVRKFCCQKSKSLPERSNTLKNDLCHDLVYNYYSLNNGRRKGESLGNNGFEETEPELNEFSEWLLSSEYFHH